MRKSLPKFVSFFAFSALIMIFSILLFKTPSDAADYQLFGDAEKSGKVITLTPADYWCGGSAWFNKPIPVTDGMTVTFEYRMTGGESARLGYADGFVVNFADTSGLGRYGEGLGFVGYGAYGVEFDNYQNDYDLADPHVAVIRDSVSNHLKEKSSSLVISKSWVKAKIVYKDKKLTVSLNGSKVLSKGGVKLPKKVYVGVSASTGDGYACHQIRNLVITGVKGDNKTTYTTNKRYKITYKLNGGKNNKSNPKNYISEESVKLADPTKSGYKFTGWYLDGDKVTKIKKGTKGNITLEAKWEVTRRSSVDATDWSTLKKRYPVLKKLGNVSRYELPGLISTNTSEGICTAMTPQGITVAEDYILVTAYCGVNKLKEDLEDYSSKGTNKGLLELENDHSKHHSVIYVINKNTGKLIKSIELNMKTYSRNHVGGITYDKNSKTIWVAGSTKKRVFSISYSRLKSSIKSGILKKWDYVSPILDVESVSFLTYYGGYLWIGTTTDIPVLTNGTVKTYKIKDGQVAARASATYKIPSNGNGIELVKNSQGLYMLINTSPERKLDSIMHIYKVNEARQKLNKIKTYTLPPMAEEIHVEGGYKGKIYTIYESGAACYSTVAGYKAKYITDRIYIGKPNSLF